MRIGVQSMKGISGGWGVVAKPCDTCKLAAAAVFCRVDSAFLCLNCDSRIHSVSKLGARHERVWMCEVCEQAPAAVTCKADAAALCVTCDADIHSANPLARRHDRVPVEPFFDSAESIVKSSPFSFLVPNTTDNGNSEFSGACQQQEDGDASSWLLSNPNVNSNPDVKSGDLFFPEMDPFLDFEYQNSMDGRFQPHHHSAGTDSVVPVQTKPAPIPIINGENCFDVDFCRSKLSSLSYPTQSLSQSVSSSSLDVGVVPDGNSMSEISYPFGRNMKGGGDPSVAVSGSSSSQASQLCGIDREARVLRYREKRKNRKFEKTIRYASRKAYAETRPRIKGRFAKRTEIDSDVDRLYSSASAVFMADAQYGVVPTF